MTPSVPGFRRFSLAEYHHLAQLGILTEDDNLELLEGYLVHKMTRTPPTTARCTSCFGSFRVWCLRNGKFAVRPPSRSATASRNRTSPSCEPTRPITSTAIPRPADVAIIIEVADSSLGSDRADKCRIYARAGIRAYWIVNIVDRQIEVYSSPVGDPMPEYRDRVDRHIGDEVDVVLAGQRVGSVAVSAALG